MGQHGQLATLEQLYAPMSMEQCQAFEANNTIAQLYLRTLSEVGDAVGTVGADSAIVKGRWIGTAQEMLGGRTNRGGLFP